MHPTHLILLKLEVLRRTLLAEIESAKRAFVGEVEALRIATRTDQSKANSELQQMRDWLQSERAQRETLTKYA